MAAEGGGRGGWLVGWWVGGLDFVGYVLFIRFLFILSRLFHRSLSKLAACLATRPFFPISNIHPTIHVSVSSPTLALSISHHLLPWSDSQNLSNIQPSYTVILIMTASMSNIMSSLYLLFCVVVNTAMFMMVWGIVWRWRWWWKGGLGLLGEREGEGKSESASENENFWGGREMWRRVGKAVVVEKMWR